MLITGNIFEYDCTYKRLYICLSEIPEDLSLQQIQSLSNEELVS